MSGLALGSIVFFFLPLANVDVVATGRIGLRNITLFQIATGNLTGLRGMSFPLVFLLLVPPVMVVVFSIINKPTGILISAIAVCSFLALSIVLLPNAAINALEVQRANLELIGFTIWFWIMLAVNAALLIHTVLSSCNSSSFALTIGTVTVLLIIGSIWVLFYVFFPRILIAFVTFQKTESILSIGSIIGGILVVIGSIFLFVVAIMAFVKEKFTFYLLGIALHVLSMAALVWAVEWLFGGIAAIRIITLILAGCTSIGLLFFALFGKSHSYLAFLPLVFVFIFLNANMLVGGALIFGGIIVIILGISLFAGACFAFAEEESSLYFLGIVLHIACMAAFLWAVEWLFGGVTAIRIIILILAVGTSIGLLIYSFDESFGYLAFLPLVLGFIFLNANMLVGGALIFGGIIVIIIGISLFVGACFAFAEEDTGPYFLGIVLHIACMAILVWAVEWLFGGVAVIRIIMLFLAGGTSIGLLIYAFDESYSYLAFLPLLLGFIFANIHYLAGWNLFPPIQELGWLSYPALMR